MQSLVIDLQGARIWHSFRAHTGFNAALFEAAGVKRVKWTTTLALRDTHDTAALCFSSLITDKGAYTNGVGIPDLPHFQKWEVVFSARVGS